jgi:hypothetical protein
LDRLAPDCQEGQPRVTTHRFVAPVGFSAATIELSGGRQLQLSPHGIVEISDVLEFAGDAAIEGVEPPPIKVELAQHVAELVVVMRQLARRGREPGNERVGCAGFQAASMRQSCRYRTHLGDFPPDLRPDQQPCPIALPEHQIGVSRRLEFGLIAKFVHHGVCCTKDIEIRQHDFLGNSAGPGGPIRAARMISIMSIFAALLPSKAEDKGVVACQHRDKARVGEAGPNRSVGIRGHPGYKRGGQRCSWYCTFAVWTEQPWSRPTPATVLAGARAPVEPLRAGWITATAALS